VGHCGTLDPLRPDLLIVVLGPRYQDSGSAHERGQGIRGHDEARRDNGQQDADGQVVETKPVPELTREQIEAAFAKFHGDFHQMPPWSPRSKKRECRSTNWARQGKVVEREAAVCARLCARNPGGAAPGNRFPRRLQQRLLVRTYAFDIGNELGCGAHLTDLRRTKSGRFTLEHAVTVEDLKTQDRELLSERILSLPTVSRMRGA
jgi:tRNA pseudouridine55 synthase